MTIQRTKEDFPKLDTWLSDDAKKKMRVLLELEFPVQEVYELVESLISDKYQTYRDTAQKACDCCKEQSCDDGCQCFEHSPFNYTED